MMCQQKASSFLTSPSSSSSSTPQSQWHQKPLQNCAAAAIQPPTAPEFLSDAISLYHTHEAGPNQCRSTVVQPVNAPLDSVWSVVRRFDAPQVYKHFIRSCSLLTDGDACSIGALREVRVVSGLPAATSTERLDVLDDDRHVIGFSIVGGDHRLTNYHSVTSIHSDPAGAAAAGSERTFIVESYVVDVPPGNTKEETCVFVDTIVRCNLQSLAHVSENQSRSALRKNPQNS